MIFSETASLRIRGYREFDLLHLVALFADPRVMRSYPGPVVPASEPAWTRTVAGFVEKALLWAILEAKTPANDGHDWVGFVALTAERAAKNREVEFGIALHAAHEGKGYGTEATRWTTHHAFGQLGMHRVSLRVLADNPRAVSIYTSLGFVEEGRAREANYQDGRWWDIVNMALLDREWKPS